MVYRNNRGNLNIMACIDKSQFLKTIIIFTWVEKTRKETMFSTDCKMECVRQAEKKSESETGFEKPTKEGWRA